MIYTFLYTWADLNKQIKSFVARQLELYSILICTKVLLKCKKRTSIRVASYSLRERLAGVVISAQKKRIS